MAWRTSEALPPWRYSCGYCDSTVGSALGFMERNGSQRAYICPNCDKPTFTDGRIQVPGTAFGGVVSHLPHDVESLYEEARRCTSASAYTAAVLICRKLLMNIAVTAGAQPGQPFISYVEYLANNGYVPPNGRGWVDHIRKKGNEATHEISVMTQEDAKELVAFTEMLAKFVYEFPNRVPRP